MLKSNNEFAAKLMVITAQASVFDNAVKCSFLFNFTKVTAAIDVVIGVTKMNHSA